MLILPFIVLVIALGATICGLSYRAGRDAAEDLSRKVVSDMIVRITQASESHLGSANIALKAVAPQPLVAARGEMPGIMPFPDDLEALEERLWVATSLSPDQNYVYFGRADGAFIGLSRQKQGSVELRLRRPGAPLRDVYAMGGPGQRLHLLRSQDYEARKRPWYAVAVERGKPVWSPVYTDFTTMEPTLTLSRPVYRNDGALAGVVATDLSLQQLTDFFRRLQISEHGIAFIVERSGAIIAASTGEPPYRGHGDKLERLMASDSTSPLLRETWGEIRALVASGDDLQPEVRQFDGAGGKVQVALASTRDMPGLDWVTVVAVPHADFMGGVLRSLAQNVAISAAAVIVAILLGVNVLQRILRDIRKLALAAHRIEQGVPMETLDISRNDELGQLAQSFIELEHGLRTDRLTGVMNRSSLIAHVNGRIRAATPDMPLQYGLLFIDLDRFKQINDVHGHDAGDRVLVETAQRLRKMLRADDKVARFGGDEFVIYLHGVTSPDYLGSICAKIERVVGEPVVLPDGARESVGASIGAAHYPSDARDLDAMFRVADERMFAVKKSQSSRAA
ncbi:MAG: diguanylate cyclase [Burkholderiaceae bacterium]